MARFYRSGRWLSVLALATILAFSGWLSGPVRAATLEEKIGQMLMFGFVDSTPGGKSAKALAKQISAGQVGGVVFLGYNFKSRAGVKGLTKMFRAASRKSPLFLAVDMEGGFVQRLGPKLGYAKVPPAQIIGETMSVKQARRQFDKLATITANAGFNVNLGPVVDLLITPENPVIAKWKRSYGADPEKVVAYARQFIAAHRKRGILAVVKHFPGHGSSLADSHAGFVDISKSWSKKELIPFAKLVSSGAARAIMPGHLLMRANSAVPASLSRRQISGVLRGQLGFRGLVISDDLQMAAIRQNFSYSKALIMAINAGVDVLMISNSANPDIDLPGKTVKLIKQAVANKRINKSRIDAAYARIITAKKNLRRN